MHKRSTAGSARKESTGRGAEQNVTAVLSSQVARKLVILEGELERAEERAEVSEV